MLAIMMQTDTFYVLVKNRNASKDEIQLDDWSVMSFGQFLEMANKAFAIDLEQRYKGLGESDASMIFPSMMNPKTRRLLRINMPDAKDALVTLQLLHGAGDEMRAARRKMLDEADITLADINN